MALIECSDCHSQFSDAAAACPKCGRPNAPGKKSPNLNGAATLAVLLGIGSCWLWFGERLYLIFPADTLIFGGVLLLYGVILFAKAPGRK